LIKNMEIRQRLLETGVKQWQLARKLDISESAMSRKLRMELSGSEKQKMLKAISEIKNQ
jgi:predicted XRE-type DNA-binding protein